VNLIQDPWIPARRKGGGICVIAPWEIGKSADPVVEIASPRPDFRGALYQFLIGLVQTAFTPADVEEWSESWVTIPSCEVLQESFYKYVDAFELADDVRPAFMQDLSLPDEAEENEIRSLLIDAPGDNTIKKNLDFFKKREEVSGLCDACIAAALFTLQTNAPSGGKGHRTGLRGGGPLTTLVIPVGEPETLWSVIWLNILYRKPDFLDIPSEPKPEVFPWMGPTRESINDRKTAPFEVNRLQQFWGMPRRIRLSASSDTGTCDICGAHGRTWTAYRSRPYGVSYDATWIHSLSPYRHQVDSEKKNDIIIATKGKQGGLSYPDWLGLTLGDEEKKQRVAPVVRSFVVSKAREIDDESDGGYRIWCFGYDMDNMKARCWYDQIMPLYVLPPEELNDYIEMVRIVIGMATEAARALVYRVESAWFNNPKDAKGNSDYIKAAFWDDTERCFFTTIEELRKNIHMVSETRNIIIRWQMYLGKSTLDLFDYIVLSDTDNGKCLGRIAHSRKALQSDLGKALVKQAN
jgi:CRISPR system Cascade subunit CasA